MAHRWTDTQRCWVVATKLLLGVLCCAVALSATARIKVANSVAKLVTEVDAQGSVQQRQVGIGAPSPGIGPGDQLHYTIALTNEGGDKVDAASIVFTNPIPENTEYVAGTASGPGTEIRFSADQGATFRFMDETLAVKRGAKQATSAADVTTIQWRFNSSLEPGETGLLSFSVVLK